MTITDSLVDYDFIALCMGQAVVFWMFLRGAACAIAMFRAGAD